MFGVTGAGLTAVKYLSNEGKKARWNRDVWDRVSAFSVVFLINRGNWSCRWLTQRLQQSTFDSKPASVRALTGHAVMERDLRITGTIRGQSGNAVAPKGFEVSNPWKVRLSWFLLVENRQY